MLPVPSWPLQQPYELLMSVRHILADLRYHLPVNRNILCCEISFLTDKNLFSDIAMSSMVEP